MGTIRRQSIQATIVLTIGVLLGFVLRLFIFTAYLTTEEIGLLTVLLDSANLFAAFIPLGSQSIFVRYLPHFKDKDRKAPRGLLLMGISLSIAGLIIFTILFLIFHKSIIGFYSAQAPLFARYLYFLLPLIFVRVVFILGEAYGRALKKNVFPLFVKEILVRVLTGIIVVAFAAKLFDLDGLILWFVGTYFAAGAIMTLYIFRRGFLDFSKAGSKLKGGMRREILYFGLFAVLTNAGDAIIRNVDSLMVTSLKGSADTGIYSTAFFIGMIIEIPRRALTQITAPFVAEAAAKDDKKMIETLYHKSSLNQFLAGSLLLICVWTNIDSLLEIVPNGEAYEPGKYVVLLIGLGKLFDMSMGINGNIIQNSRHYRFNFYSLSLLAVLGITTNFILIPRMGIIGAATASLVSIFLINILKGFFIKQKLGIHPFRMDSFRAIAVSAIVYGVASLLPSLHTPILDVLYRSLISLILFLTLAYILKVSQDLNLIIKVALKKIRGL